MILSAQEMSSFPSAPTVGQVVFNTTLDGAYIWAPGASGVVSGGWLFVANGTALRDSERITDSLTRASYAGKDYQTFIDEVTANVKATFGAVYNDFIGSSPGQMLIRFISAAMDTLSWNMDARSTELYIFLANLRSSVSREARRLGYKPRQGVASSVNLDLTLTSGPYAFDITIPAGFQFPGPNGLIFEQTVAVTIPAGSTTSLGVAYHQGTTVTETFTSNGTGRQVFSLRRVGDGNYIAKGTVEITVGADTWSEYDFLPFDTVNAFEVSYDTTPPFVRFGDGVVGNVPKQGSDIQVKYVATQGKKGNSIPVGSIATPSSSLTVNFTDIPIKATNAKSSSGGDNPEDPRSVQANAPLVFATGQRAVSQPDWDALLNAYSDPLAGAVARGRAMIIRGVQNEQTIQSLLAAIITASDPSGALGLITGNNAAIRTSLAALRTTLGDVSTQGTGINALVSAITASITALLSQTGAAKTQLASLKTSLGTLPYQELVAVTDGASATYNGTLTRLPVVPGTVSIMLDPFTPVGSWSVDLSTAGQAKVTAAAPFTSNMLGQTVSIAGEFRNIRQVIDGSTIAYSGPTIANTGSPSLTLYDKAVSGFDDGAGSIAGPGITAGSVNYSTGAISVTFSSAPSGNGQVGRPVMVFYRYASTSLQGDVDTVVTGISGAETNANAVTGSLASVTADVTTIANDVTSALGTVAGVQQLTVQSDQNVATAGQVKASVTTATGALEDYLDKVISGDCKANIVQCKVLAHDANGQYTSPSQALLDSVETHFESIKVITQTVSAVDGSTDLIAADMEIKIEVAKNYKYSNVQPLVDTAVTSLLTDRYYDVTLAQSELWSAIVPKPDGTGGIEGVKSAVIKITGSHFVSANATGTPPVPNADGDLVPGVGQCIVKGNISYSELVRTTATS